MKVFPKCNSGTWPSDGIELLLDPLLIAWTEGTGWEKGGSLGWELLDSHGAALGTGRAKGVPVWSYAAAFGEPDGSFTLLY